MKKILLLFLLSCPLYAGGILKQSTATTINIGPFIDDTDFKTLKTALTVTNMTVKLIKQSDTFSSAVVSFSPTASGGSNDCQHVASAMYNLELTTTDTGTLGRLDVVVTVATSLVVFDSFMIVVADAYAASVTAPITILGIWEFPTGSISAGIGNQLKINADSPISSIPGATWDEPIANHLVASKFGQALQPIRTGTAQAGAATTITLDSGASAINNFYQWKEIILTNGAGSEQSAIITAYTGSTKVATIFNTNKAGGTWHTTPDSTSVFKIIPYKR